MGAYFLLFIKNEYNKSLKIYMLCLLLNILNILVLNMTCVDKYKCIVLCISQKKIYKRAGL